ncbi:hypothetical protein Tco_0767509 [Tanacetum coccineum]
MGQECSPKNPTNGTFESTLDTLMGDFSFKKQCSQITSHDLSLSMYTRLTCLSKILAVIVIGAEELWFLVTGGNVISLHSEVGPSKVLLLTQGRKVALILQLLQSGFLADGNHWCRAHDLRVNGSTWSCLEIVCFQTFEEVARKFLLPFPWLEFLLDFWTGIAIRGGGCGVYKPIIRRHIAIRKGLGYIPSLWVMGVGSPKRGVTILSPGRVIQSLSIDDARKWLGVRVNKSRYESIG